MSYTVQGEDMDFSLRGVTTITDSADSPAELVLASSATVAVSKEPEIEDPDSDFSATAQVEFKNLVQTFRTWQRDLKRSLLMPSPRRSSRAERSPTGASSRTHRLKASSKWFPSGCSSVGAAK